MPRTLHTSAISSRVTSMGAGQKPSTTCHEPGNASVVGRGVAEDDGRAHQPRAPRAAAGCRSTLGPMDRITVGRQRVASFAGITGFSGIRGLVSMVAVVGADADDVARRGRGLKLASGAARRHRARPRPPPRPAGWSHRPAAAPPSCCCPRAGHPAFEPIIHFISGLQCRCRHCFSCVLESPQSAPRAWYLTAGLSTMPFGRRVHHLALEDLPCHERLARWDRVAARALERSRARERSTSSSTSMFDADAPSGRPASRSPVFSSANARAAAASGEALQDRGRARGCPTAVRRRCRAAPTMPLLEQVARAPHVYHLGRAG